MTEKVNLPTLSVLIPTYKRPKALKKLLESIINAQIPATEIVIGDDGGDTETLELLKTYSLQVPIRHLLPDGNGSLASNITRLFKSVTTEWSFFIHDDDFVVGNHYQLFSQIDEAYDFFFTDHFISDEEGKIDMEETSKNSKVFSRDKLAEGIQSNSFKLSLDQCVCLDGFYIRNRTISVFPDAKLGQVADFFWMHELLTSGVRIGFSSERSFAYVLSQDGLTGSGGRLNEDNVKGFRVLYEKEKNDEKKNILWNKVTFNSWYAINACIRRGEKKKAIELIKGIKFRYKDSLKHQILLPLQLFWLLIAKGSKSK